MSNCVQMFAAFVTFRTTKSNCNNNAWQSWHHLCSFKRKLEALLTLYTWVFLGFNPYAQLLQLHSGGKLSLAVISTTVFSFLVTSIISNWNSGGTLSCLRVKHSDLLTVCPYAIISYYVRYNCWHHSWTFETFHLNRSL